MSIERLQFQEPENQYAIISEESSRALELGQIDQPIIALEDLSSLPLALDDPSTDPPEGFHAETSVKDLSAQVAGRYSPYLSSVEATKIQALATGAAFLRTVAQSPLGERVRSMLPVRPDVIATKREVTPEGDCVEKTMEPYPWQWEIRAFDPEHRAVVAISDGKYNVEDPYLVATIVSAFDESTLSGNEDVDNNLFRTCRDAESSKFGFTDVDNTAMAVIEQDGTVVIVPFDDMHYRSINGAHELLNGPAALRITNREDLRRLTEGIGIQMVVDCSGESIARKVPPYVLLDRHLKLQPTTGFTVDHQTGEVRGYADHAMADGTSLQAFTRQIFDTLDNHYRIGTLEREEQRFGLLYNAEYITPPGEKIQMAEMKNLQYLSYADRHYVTLRALHQHPMTRGMESSTMVVTTDYPEPITGDRKTDMHASFRNRIGVGQEHYKKHETLFGVMDAIKATLQAQYGKKWLEEAAIRQPEDYFSALPQEMVAAFRSAYAHSRAMTQQEIDLARKNQSLSIKLARAYHGPELPRPLAKLGEKLLSQKTLGLANGGALVTDIKVEEFTMRGGQSSDMVFTTITPNSGRMILATLSRTIERNQELIRQMAHVNPDIIDRDIDTLSRTTHLVSWRSEEAEGARAEMSVMLDILAEEWQFMDMLKALR